MSFNALPARNAAAIPSPVERNGFVVRVQKIRPAPPVDKITAFALICSTRPSFMFHTTAPPT